MPRIVRAKAMPPCKLEVRFEDGSEGTVDLADCVGKGVFSAWEDVAVFEQVSVDPESGTVTWPGGIDLCPDQLYHDITGAPVPGAGQPRISDRLLAENSTDQKYEQAPMKHRDPY